MPVVFQTSEISFKVSKPRKIREWLRGVIADHKKEAGAITYVFMSDELLIDYNRRYLKHNTYTDIITFDYGEGKVVSGDILISVDRVKENADRLGTGFEEELRRVMVHGVLHLCGYKDKQEQEKKRMRILEDKALKKFNSQR